jgi:hypothetical protein
MISIVVSFISRRSRQIVDADTQRAIVLLDGTESPFEMQVFFVWRSKLILKVLVSAARTLRNFSTGSRLLSWIIISSILP